MEVAVCLTCQRKTHTLLCRFCFEQLVDIMLGLEDMAEIAACGVEHGHNSAECCSFCW